MLLEPEQRVHLIERRQFPEDARRHFAGEVEVCSEHGFRVRGRLFVYDGSRGEFVRKRGARTRVIFFDNLMIVNLLPDSVDPDALRYEHDSEGALVVTDGSDFAMDINEFSGRE